MSSNNGFDKVPQWINEDYFRSIIEKKVPKFRKVVSFKAIPAISPGESYASTIIRVHIDVQLIDRSKTKLYYILKTMLEKSAGADYAKSMNLFPKEMEIYQSVLPKFEALYQEAGREITLSPKCIFIDEISENITIIMEDLARRKFKNVNRLEGLDMQHMHHGLSKLAEFHAASVVWNEHYGPFKEKFLKGFFKNENRKMYKEFHKSREEILRKAMIGWGLDDPEYYLAKLPNADSCFDSGMKSNIIDPTELNVLNHGDCWSNNLMFNYTESGSINETLFIDFQVCKWGTPAEDLWHLIFASAATNIKTKEFDRFIQIYQIRLRECLQILGYSKTIPTLKDLHMMMLKHGFWGYLVATGVMTVSLLEPDKDATTDIIFNSGEEGEKLRRKIYGNPLYAKAMCEVLPFLDKRGLLEF